MIGEGVVTEAGIGWICEETLGLYDLPCKPQEYDMLRSVLGNSNT